MIDGRLQRVYIPPGIQHMNGEQALIYARSRHGSNDFDRGARQQRVLLSVREQTNISTILPTSTRCSRPSRARCTPTSR